jgi:hypothetical protein
VALLEQGKLWRRDTSFYQTLLPNRRNFLSLNLGGVVVNICTMEQSISNFSSNVEVFAALHVSVEPIKLLNFVF